MQNKHYKNDTSLSSYIRKIKGETEQIKILTWPTVRTVLAYSNTTEKYALCLHDKFEIFIYNNLGEFSEIMSRYAYQKKYFLSNYENKDSLISLKVYFKCMYLS